MKIGKTIVEDNLIISKKSDIKTRKTVRAIVINNKNEVLMMYSKLFNDYTFPGGGVKNHETLDEALLRELSEEVGAIDVTIKERVGRIKEYKYSISDSPEVYRQISYYFVCEVGSYGATNLVPSELYHGLEPKFLNVEEVIKHNKEINKTRINQNGMQTVLIRENRILNKIREKLNEKIWNRI